MFTNSRTSATTRFRELLATTKPLLVLGAYNALSAKIVEAAGFPAAYMTGYGTSLSMLGLPDAGLITASEMLANARHIANAVSIPVIADADDGYGNAVNVMRTVRDYIQTGVAGIHLEDQLAPKRCGHVAGRVLVPVEEAVGKVRAAHSVRQALDPDFVLIARTDARGTAGGGLDEAIRRANAYLEAGADIAFVEGPTSEAEVRRVLAEVHGPILYNQTGVSPRFSREQLQALGLAVVIFAGVLLRVSIASMLQYATAFQERGPIVDDASLDRNELFPLPKLHAFSGFDQVRRLEEEFLPAAHIEKYEGSLGYRPESHPSPTT